MFRFDLFVIGAFLTGAVIPLQLAFNAQLGQVTRNPYSAGLIVFLLGMTVFLVLIAIDRTPMPRLDDLTAAPVTIWFGGVLAALYIFSVVSLTPRLGVGTITMLILAGQIFMALLIDHFGAFGAQQHSISVQKIVGATLVLVGAILVRMDSQ